MNGQARNHAPADEIISLFAEQGQRHFGEVVTQQSHAIQTARAAQAAGADSELVAAGLLHDIGHLLFEPGTAADDSPGDSDDRHEAIGARWLASRFQPRVSQAVALHVMAKRFRCTVDPGYHDQLSGASKETLRLQGGLLTDLELHRFECHPGFEDALLLRDCDEAGKLDIPDTSTIDSFADLLNSVARP